MNCEGGGIDLGIIGGIYGGAAGLSAVVLSGNSASLNHMWKGYVSGALAGAAIGALIPGL